MSQENPYSAPYKTPDSNLETSIDPRRVPSRKELIPLWIKIFGWIFIVVGVLVTGIAIFSAITGLEGEYSFYGLQAIGSIYSPTALFIVALFIAHGACAFGLLFGKSWGLIACLILACISIATCLVTMVTGDDFTIRLELALLIPYAIKLYKIKDAWKVAR